MRKTNTKEMLVGAFILIATVFSTNGYPYSVEPQIPHIEFQIPEEQQIVFQNVDQLNSPEQYDDYFAGGDSKFTEHESDFTISCVGADKICTAKSDCVNGYTQSINGAAYYSVHSVQQCRVLDQVCCSIIREHTGTFVKTVEVPAAKEGSEQSAVGSPSQTGFALATPLQTGCAAALICVEEQYCTLDGTISKEPVTFSEKELFKRVPLSSCKNPDNGIIGKCCRDPNYVDPWPTGNLPANYSGGFDEQGFPTFLNIAKVKPPQPVEPKLVPANTHLSTKTLVPPYEDKRPGKDYETAESRLACGVRNQASEIIQPEQSKTVFAEIPWQAMVLHSKDRKILCSGALVGSQEVLTAANCVDSLTPNDVSIKLGEWKLGYDLKHEEPLPFEIINVSSINIHPGYRRGVGQHDLAMVHLETPATFDRHINPLCLPEPTKLPNNKLCISTGWGKSILQAHYAGAILHAVNMDVLSTQRCKEQLAYTNIAANIAGGSICAAVKDQRNNVCETDVGGPLACQNEDGHYELAGIYSQDTGCLATDQVAVFASLDDKWLKESMSQQAPQIIKINNSVEDFRRSFLSTDNQYLPPN